MTTDNTDFLKQQFPMFAEHPELVYLDTAATSQKPEIVLKTLDRYYRCENSNVHRGLYALSESATVAYEQSRQTVADFLNAWSSREIIFTRGTTEAINLAAWSLSRMLVGEGDYIVVSQMEHHSNFVPWQQAALDRGASLLTIPVSTDAELMLNVLEETEKDGRVERIRVVSVGHISNSFGTINPVRTISRWCKKHDIPLVVDAAQSAPHIPVDVRELGADLLAFSGHKAYGPMGSGVLWGREDLLESMPPWQSGGEMISSVKEEKTTWNDVPHKFEAGTPDVAAVIGLSAALKWILETGHQTLADHERRVGSYLLDKLAEMDGVTLYGLKDLDRKIGIFPFNVEGVHGHDVAQYLDRQQIAVRAGHHCTQPAMRAMNIPYTTRISLGPYNTMGDIDRLVDAMRGIQSYFL